MASLLRRTILKTVAVALVVGGNCWVCTMTTPEAMAAVRPASPALAQCADIVTPPDFAVIHQQPDDDGCPMSEHHDGSAAVNNETFRPLTDKFTPDGLAASAVITGDIWPSFSPMHLLASVCRLNGDRSSPLTGIIVKNE